MATANGTSISNASDGYFNLGTYSHPIRTQHQKAQLWFDRGLIWAYGFNRKEAQECFDKAIAADPECAMCYWGKAYSSGAYYNKSWPLHDKNELKQALKDGYQACQDGLQRIEQGSPAEQALIRAMQHRFPHPDANDDLSKRDQSFAQAMESVYKDHGDDLDVAVLYAESLMNLTPWRLWDLYTGEPAPGSRALDAKSALEHGFTLPGAYQHPGLLHFYIHLIEMSREPELGIKAADALRHLVPDGGHVTHMPSHLDVVYGNYRDAIAANAAALVADERYVQKVGSMNMYTMYRMHNYHSLIYAAMFAGKSQVAIEYTEMMEKSIPEELLRIESPPMADWLETFMSVMPHVLIRFGRWSEIIDLPLPKDQKLYCVTVAMIHYAKGVAYAAQGRIEQAEDQQNLYRAAQKRVPDSRYDFPNKCCDELEVGEEMLAGEIEYRKGNYDEAFEHLRKAVHLDDNLVYSEPW